MPRPPSPSIPEREFLFAALKQGLRLDGRAPLQQRTPVLLFGPELGWVDRALGKTRVIASVDAKMVKPTPERPFEGIVSIHSEISPMASPEYEPGRPSDEEVALSRMLDKVVRRSDSIDKESLCVIAGQRVWHLRLTIHCLSDAGNILDCAVLASAVALRHFRRPDVEVIGDEVTVHDPSERAPVPLALHHTPLCYTFAFYPPPPSASSPLVLLDPTLEEARLVAGTLSVALTPAREICVMHMAGVAGGLDPPDVLDTVRIAGECVKITESLIAARLREDWEGRKVEVR